MVHFFGGAVDESKDEAVKAAIEAAQRAELAKTAPLAIAGTIHFQCVMFCHMLSYFVKPFEDTTFVCRVNLLCHGRSSLAADYFTAQVKSWLDIRFENTFAHVFMC